MSVIRGTGEGGEARRSLGEEPAASLLPTVAARGRSPSWKPAGRAGGSRVLAPRAVE